MIIKDKFELIYGRGSDINNHIYINPGMMETLKVVDEENEYIKNLVKMFTRTKSQSGADIVLKYINTCTPVKLPQYPLPGFVDNKFKPYCNLSALTSTSTSDYAPADIYSMYLYSIALSIYMNKKPFQQTIEEHVSAFFFAIFMKFFGKKSGLMGSYKDLIPKLRFLIWLYVHCSMMGNPDSEAARKKISSSLYVDTSDLNLDYDFSKIEGLINSISGNRIIALSVNKFSTQIINIGGISSLPMFEDISRFFATILASNISGSMIFSSYWSKVRPDLFQKLVYIGSRYLSV